MTFEVPYLLNGFATSFYWHNCISENVLRKVLHAYQNIITINQTESRLRYDEKRKVNKFAENKQIL